MNATANSAPTPAMASPTAAHPGAVYVLPGQRRDVSVQAPEWEAGRQILVKTTTRGRPVEFHATPVAP